jgi:hypothetical protein
MQLSELQTEIETVRDQSKGPVPFPALTSTGRICGMTVSDR